MKKKISKDFENNGFIIRDVKNNQSLRKIRGLFLNSVKNLKAVSKIKNDEDKLNLIHKFIKPHQLNVFRMKIINDINKSKEIRKLYYDVSRNT